MLKRPEDPPPEAGPRARPEFYIRHHVMSHRDSVSKLHLTPARERGLRSYLAQIGAMGGRAKGAAKVRGDRGYYRALALKRWGEKHPVD